MARLVAAIAAADGEAGAHCVHELWMRGEPPMNVEAALARLWERATATIPDWLPMRYVDWLPALYEVAGQCVAGRKGRTHIYLVLLDYADSARGPFGIYVGMSRYRAALRFDQHKAGIRAAGSVLKRGMEVLTGPVQHLQFIARQEAARIEIELAEALRARDLIVKGGH
ncbi:MAG TPA: hypothetical protein VD701_07970 [Steroidobacteraceae bacterium]|nr:hypothetical protein [Steroidobacteraceae bacterium]